GYLQGRWILDGHQFLFQEGMLINHQTAQRLVLNNPPLEDPDFVRFVRDWDLYHPQGPKLVFQQNLPWKSLSHAVQWSLEEQLPPAYHVLNTHTLNALLGQYEVTEEHALRKTPGLIEQAPSTEIPLYLTATLADSQWISLLSTAITHH